MELLKELFAGEAIGGDEFIERLKARPDIAGEFVRAKEVDKLKARLEAEKSAREKESADFALQMAAARRDMLIDVAVASSGARSIKAVKALINDEAVTLSDGELCGIAEELERVGKDCPYLFTAASRGVNPPAPANGAAAPPPDEHERWREEAGLTAR